MVQRVYYPPPGPSVTEPPSAEEPARERGLLEVRHGYTLADLDAMARAATIADRSMAMDLQDRRDIAWSAIAEALWTAETPPRRRELIGAGLGAIYGAVREEKRHGGYADRAWESGYGSAPGFSKYWYPLRVVRSHEGRIVERAAVEQVLAALGAPYRDALIALAVRGDYRSAARALGITDPAFRARISRARRDALGYWFEGETPRRVRTSDRRVRAYEEAHCPLGHRFTPENTGFDRRIVRGTLRKRRYCRTCVRDRQRQRRLARGRAPTSTRRT